MDANTLGFERREINGTYKRISIRDFRENMADALNFASFERKPVVLTKNGEERVGIVPLEYIWFIDQLSKKIDIDLLVLRNRTTEMVWEEIRAKLKELSGDSLQFNEYDDAKSSQSGKERTS